MRRRRVLWLLILLLGIANTGYGISALPAHSVFYMPPTDGKSGQPYLETYWQIDPQSVNFIQDTAGLWIGKIKTEIKVYCDTGTIANDKYYLKTTKASSLRAAQLQNIMDLHRYVVPAGKTIYITLKLSENGFEKKAFSYTDSVFIEPQETPYYSQVQLLSNVYKYDEEQNMFYKNGHLQVPLCFDFLDEPQKQLYYYLELYGTDKIKAADLPLTQDVFISKKEFAYVVYKLKNADTIRLGKITPVLDSFRVDVLPSGNYHVNVILRNNKGQKIAQQSLFFQRSNPNPYVPEDTTTADSTQPMFEEVELFDLSTTFVAEYTPPQLLAILKMLKPIATESELLNIEGFSDRPDLTYIRYFIYNFWKAHNPLDPEGGWKEYTKSVRDVNDLFGSRSKPGYETERGFFYLKYGPPDQRYVVSSEQGAWPYEVWQYNAPGKQSSSGAFLFYNPGYMVNEYALLHTTVQGEMRNSAWRSMLYKNNTGSTGNLNSRAEQVFSNR